MSEYHIPNLPEPYYQDGTYNRDPLHFSPEGYQIGQKRFYVVYPREYWWDGSQYIEICPDTIEGTCAGVGYLPAGPRPFGEIWKVLAYLDSQTNKRVFDTYYWDSEWKRIHWYWKVEHVSELPNPGISVGAGHVVEEPDVQMYWDGFQFRRFPHSGLGDDEPERHLPAGFVTGVDSSLNQFSKFYTPDARLVYLSTTEIALESIKGGAGVVNVAGEWIAATPNANVNNTVKALNWIGDSLYQEALIPDTDYWIYLANNQSDEFNFLDYDYRGKLFLSVTEDTSDYLSDDGAGANARLVGQVRTTQSDPPQFHRNLNLSLISVLTNFAETYREFSDYQVVFVDESHIQMQIGYGLKGQIAISDYLYYLGGSTPTIDRTDSIRVEWDDDLDDRLFVDDTEISISTLYYIYIGADIDTLNFNPINPATSRPWLQTDSGSTGNYDPDLDLRLSPFLSTKEPESGLMSEEYPGFYIRWIGQVRTDSNGYFVNAPDISVIRQLTLNPAHLSGLAEVKIEVSSTTQVRMVKARGSSGIILVGGQSIETYEIGDERVHTLNNTDQVYTYDESQISAPLESTGHNVSYYASSILYLYLANHEPCWGALAGLIFASTDAPINGYMSQNWAGTNARFVARLALDANGEFTGSAIAESIGQVGLLIADGEVSTDKLWSSAKIRNELNLLMALFSAEQLYTIECNGGLPVLLEYVNSSTIHLRSMYDSSIIAFPDMTTRQISSTGISLTVSGATGHYYVYLTDDDFYLSTDAPDDELAQLEILGADAVLVGEVYLTSQNTMSGIWNVCSSHNEPTREWSFPITSGSMSNLLPGLVATRRITGTVVRSGYSGGSREWSWGSFPYIMGPVTLTGQIQLGSHTWTKSLYSAPISYLMSTWQLSVTCAVSTPAFEAGVITVSYSDTITFTHTYYYPPTDQDNVISQSTWRTGSITITRQTG